MTGCGFLGIGQRPAERITFHPDSTGTARDENLPAPEELIEVDEQPVRIYEEPPIYPVAARRANAAGTVTVRVFVGPQGKVLKANALECDHPGYGFEIAAVAAAYKGKWRPAMADGKPVGVWVTYSIDFAHH
jgi:TonB family protein